MKRTETYKVIGMMSGTSLDGLDLAYCTFTLNQSEWAFEINLCCTIPYPEDIFLKLQRATTLSTEDLLELDALLGDYMGKQVCTFLKENRIENSEVDLIASHGHTIFHQPKRGFTFQIGNGNRINHLTGISVINDFRSRDVALGGEGAPLVPMGDLKLFNEYTACLNLGGISNVSFQKNGERLAFDICPVNMLLNTLSQQIGLNYDSEGAIAKKGRYDAEVYAIFEQAELSKKGKKFSLGFEWIEKNYLIPLSKLIVPIENKLFTSVEYIAKTISSCLNEHVKGKVLITGGGAHNQFLIEQISSFCPSLEIIVPEKVIVDNKEALIFGFLGVLRMRNEVNCLKSVTGARMDNCGGTIISSFNS